MLKEKKQVLLGFLFIGIPIIKEDSKISEIEAVTNKDYIINLLTRRIKANLIIIATGIEKYKRGEFSLGNMGTKILAIIGFIEETGNEIIITLCETTMNALNGKRGIRIIKE